MSLGGGARSKISNIPCHGRNASSSAARRSVATLRVFTLGRAPRCQRHNRLDASLRIGRGKDSPSTEAVPNQTNPLVVDINVEPETVAGQHLIHKKPHIRHATPDHPVDDKRPMFCSLRPACELRGDQFGMVECADHIAVTGDMR